MISQRIAPTRFSAMRLNAGLTQKDLSNEINKLIGDQNINPTSISQISAWEQGRRHIPVAYFDILSKIFGATIDYLKGDTDDPQGTAPKKKKSSAKIISEEIPVEHLWQYDNAPIYVVFTNMMHPDAWGIYNNKRRNITFPDFVLRIDSTTVTKDFLKFYRYKPSFDASFIPSKSKALSFGSIMPLKQVYIEMKSSSESIRALYDGWYSHNEDHTALINSRGYVLPYDGLGFSYMAYQDPNYTDQE